MDTRQKFSYMILGGALVFLGMLEAMISPLTAEKDKFGEIECTKLTVVAETDEVITLTASDYGGLVKVHSKDGRAGALLNVNEHGGGPSVHSNDGKTRGILTVNEHGRSVSVTGNDGNPRGVLTVHEDGGAVGVFGNDEEQRVGLEVNKKGNGAVSSTWDKDGSSLTAQSERFGVIELQG